VSTTQSASTISGWPSLCSPHVSTWRSSTKPGRARYSDPQREHPGHVRAQDGQMGARCWSLFAILMLREKAKLSYIGRCVDSQSNVGGGALLALPRWPPPVSTGQGTMDPRRPGGGVLLAVIFNTWAQRGSSRTRWCGRPWHDRTSYCYGASAMPDERRVDTRQRVHNAKKMMLNME
jgi:hypothetical protein